jgi:TPP-dependent 2-oxoacid decarboxylase
MPRASFVSNFVLPTRADRSACRWGSIGYATGASVGMAYAAKELGRRLWPAARLLKIAGEGSCQVTVQDLAQMMRLGESRRVAYPTKC